MDDKPWEENFITRDKLTGEYICWDETRTEEIGRAETRHEAVAILNEYADLITPVG
jgi:hypothetical protein